MIQNREIRNRVRYLLEAYSRQSRAPTASRQKYLNGKLDELRKLVNSIYPRIKSPGARRASTEVIRHLSLLASDARLKLFNLQINQAKAALSREVRKPTPKKKVYAKKGPTKKNAKKTVARKVALKPWR